MSVNVTTAEDGKISCQTAEGSVININVVQPSMHDPKRRNNLSEVPTISVKSDALAVILGVSLMPLGIIYVVFGCMAWNLNIQNSYICDSKALLWIGFPVFFCGVFEIVTFLKNGFWVFVSFFLQLLSFCVSIAGIALCVLEQQAVLKRTVYNVEFLLVVSDPLLKLHYTALAEMMAAVVWGAISTLTVMVWRLNSFNWSACLCEKPPSEQNTVTLENTNYYSTAHHRQPHNLH